eukprot:m.15829 g.15829  ORF g.15829 m.15829 type:complete len:539 (-) comp3072_c0_seq1:122-1738(-)
MASEDVYERDITPFDQPAKSSRTLSQSSPHPQYHLFDFSDLPPFSEESFVDGPGMFTDSHHALGALPAPDPLPLTRMPMDAPVITDFFDDKSMVHEYHFQPAPAPAPLSFVAINALPERPKSSLRHEATCEQLHQACMTPTAAHDGRMASPHMSQLGFMVQSASMGESSRDTDYSDYQDMPPTMPMFNTPIRRVAMFQDQVPLTEPAKRSLGARKALTGLDSPRTPLAKLSNMPASHPMSAPGKLAAARLLASPRIKSPQVPDSAWTRLNYSPLINCGGEHDLCQRRMALGIEALLSGQYISEVSPEVEQACDGEMPIRRVQHVEDNQLGCSFMMQLHLVRAREGDYDRRPLLLPNLPSLAEAPTYRMLTSPKFFAGQFFRPDGSCETDRHILICFPKMHRGSVRLQVKVFDRATNAVSRDKEDLKAHFLSYVIWLFGLSKGAKLNKWPSVNGECKYSRRRPGDFGNDEFLCINPFHYVHDEADRAKLAGEITASVNVCLRGQRAMPGERAHPSGESYCFCRQCQAAALSSIPGPLQL